LQALHLYGADDDFIKGNTTELTSADIIKASLMPSTSKVSYLVGNNAISATKDLRVSRARIASDLGKTDYDTTVAAAMRFEVDKVSRGDMVPVLLQFDLNNTYPDDSHVENPSSASDFHSKYQMMKYFESDKTKYAINLSNVMGQHGPNYIFRSTTTGRFELTPLVVFVNDLAPDNGKIMRVGDRNQYGAYYDDAKKILFIYDGDPNDKIEDPIVLEKRPSNGGGGGGGGGGGCSAGAGVVALIALAGVALARRSRG
jgi:hypothetical protein